MKIVLRPAGISFFAFVCGVVVPRFLIATSLAAFQLCASSAKCAGTETSLASDNLERGFAQPPPESKPWCYWYWLSGHISKEGITKDLEAMARWGIGQAAIGDINRPNIARGPVAPLSDDYFAMIEHAVREGERLGVNISMFNCSGWSQAGGPWIKPEQAMRYLDCTERRVSGPSVFKDKLPEPESKGTKASPIPEDFVQNVAVLAFPSPRGDADTLALQAPKVTCDPAIENADLLMDGKLETVASFSAPAKKGGKLVFEVTAREPFTARSLTLHLPLRNVEPDRGKAGAFDADCELLAENADGSFRSVRKFDYRRNACGEATGPMTRGPVTISFPLQSAKRFRLVLENIKLRKDIKKVSLAEIELSGGARLESFIEQQLGKMCPEILPPWDYYLWRSQPEPDAPQFCIDPSRMVDLTKQVAAGGVLTWNVPPGEWTIVRVVMRPTGVKNVPAAKEATGLEVDKMSPAAMAEHYKAYMGKVVSRIPAEQRKALRGFMIDSYETGSQNWTDDAREMFMKSYGYDPIPWLPTLTGRLVGSADQSTRFMWDLRRFVADRIANAYGSFRDLGNRDGMKFWLEPYGHYGFPAEFLQLGSSADGIGGEFWISPKHGGMEVLGAVSGAHIYGKQIVSSEAYTGTPSYGFTQDPWALKPLGDFQQTNGINHFVLHVYIHQPEERAPGMNSWFGTEFNRHNTWFEKGKAWIDYLRRSHFLLQQGLPVVDVAYFIGEDAPKMSGTRGAELPEGYRADDINGEAIRDRLQVKDGHFVLPDGMSYRLLVLPPLDTMRPELLEKLRGLIAEGGVVLGPPPSRSPSMQDYPKADQKVRKLAQEIWGNLDGKTRREARFGKGGVFQGMSVQEVLQQLDVPRDIAGLDAKAMLWTAAEGPVLPWFHRTTPEGEIYFISNQSNQPVSASASFRVAGKQPELWDPVTAKHRALPEFTQEGERTVVPLHFEARQSLFVLFRKPAQMKGGGSNFPQLQTVGSIDTPWTVTFDPRLGGPASVVFAQLEDWTKRSEPGIKNYSGPAIYHNVFDLPAEAKGHPVLLDLGSVRSLAQVRLNGKDLGVIWCKPWSVDIGSAVQEKNNKLEIEVVNTWINRLLADEKIPAAQRITWVASPAIRAQTPLPAGLFGPVTLKIQK
ncbi:MAG: glycosyl hydrolase [Verrucomicrobia bacterium]|nr:glycosyl hydrolase [Verrucomicrobiota bacterium]